jgi:hypothetical protein
MDGLKRFSPWHRFGTAKNYPAFLLPVERSGFVAFLAAGFFPSIGSSIFF